MYKKQRSFLYYGAVLFCLLGAVGTGGIIARRFLDERQNNGRLEALARLVRPKTEGNQSLPFSGDKDGQERLRGTAGYERQLALRKLRLSEYEKLKEQNPDLAGWLTIPGTRIDYPVMWTPEEPHYYLKHDFDRKKSVYGVPYIGENGDPGREGGVLTLYGHHMKNGSMFAGLMDYTDEEFYKQHPYLWFDTLEEPGLYRIVGAMKESAIKGDQDLLRFVTGAGEDRTGGEEGESEKADGGQPGQEEFERFMKKLKEKSFYDTGYTASREDQLLILTTCEYSQREGRLLVVAGKADGFGGLDEEKDLTDTD